MDLENFDNIDHDLPTASSSYPALSAASALEKIDHIWYRSANRRARWMDLLGDYAGSEPFVIDGESLFQVVLDDPLLALGRENEISFQILHAFQILERALLQFESRSANIEIVFWREHRHTTVRTGDSQYVVASRTLARSLLLKHLLDIDIPVHEFEDLEDPSWLRYQVMKKPMFVMANDGGILGDGVSNFAAERLLDQRAFLFRLLSRGIPVALLQGSEYRDSKILSFVHEQHRVTNSQTPFPNTIWMSIESSKRSLDLKRDEEASKLAPVSKFSRDSRDVNSVLLASIAQNVQDGVSVTHCAELLYIFLAHCVILRTLSVYERARQLEGLDPKLFDAISVHFLPKLYFIAAQLLSSSTASLDVDGRIFCSLVRYCILHSSEPLPKLIGSPTYAVVQDIWTMIGSPPLDIPGFAAHFSDLPPSSSQRPAKHKPFRLLPFKNDVFDVELSLVDVPVYDTDKLQKFTHLEFGQNTLFSDTQHWHSQKSLLPDHLTTSRKPMDERSRRRALKQNQRFMATMQLQASTLTGALGGILQQIKIPSVRPSNAPPRSRPSYSKPVKEPKLSSADKLRNKIQKEKSDQQDNASQLWWKAQLETMSGMTTRQKISQLDSLNRNKRNDEQAVGSEMLLYRIHLEILIWIEDTDNESPSSRDKYTVTIMRMMKDMCDRGFLTPAISKALSSVFLSLGFPTFSSEMLSNDETTPKKRLHFEFVKLIKSKTGTPYHSFMHITENPIEWQLRLFGEFMDRSMDGAPDRRVSFKPDAWQREVLDCIDKRSSLLVVAPTSAGKTFISYYAMEKVLRDSDDGILVYIAPTKALVTQIAAEVYARFSKDLNGKSCWAIHTRDYRVHDPQKCQILVTVPEMLAIMLLSPHLARVWTPRIKTVILDEIHSIGQQEGGAVWEQIILLTPCPIIGLSATIGSPEIFNDWLKSVQEAHGHEHTFIQYRHRYSHLRKFYYNLSEERPKSFLGLQSHQPTTRTRFLHPISLLSFGARSLPPDFVLEPGDTLSLFNALRPYQHLNDDIATLEPSLFFASKPGLLRQKDILEYEARLKDVLSQFITSYDVQDSSTPLHHIIHSLDDPSIARLSSQNLNTPPSREVFKENLIYLLADLQIRGELPAILFNFDRTDCEIMAQMLVSTLQEAETEWRSKSPEWKRTIQDWENWKSHSKDRERYTEREKRRQKVGDEQSASDYSWEMSFNPEDPTPAFSFAGAHTSYSKVDLDDDIRSIARWTSTPRWAFKALRRGIAVHHAGMNKRYRSLVESLFRQGFVRVVIATGTLALGINAPTKTSVFCGDSPYLTALMYRQCAGRAGRRGYDLLGNVVFYGLPLDRVQRLVLSKLPSLGGNFPVTSTLILRLFNLLDGSDYAPVAVNAVKSIMSLPHVSFGSNTGRHQLLHHLRFSIEFLRRSCLLNRDGRPMNLFAIAAHLYYTEPSNFALVALLRRGVLHTICKQPNTVAAQRDFVILMAHLFGRKYIPRAYATESIIGALTKKYPSLIVLPPLPSFANKALIQHDQEILEVFTGYARTYASAYDLELGKDTRLPMSGTYYVGVGQSLGLKSAFKTYLEETAIPVVTRSPFVANSGHGDEFKSVQELARTTREGLHLNEHAIPSLGHLIAPDHDGVAAEKTEDVRPVLNAYLLDFYTHGQPKTLAAANGIRRGDVWYLLEDFSLTLKTVKASLEQLLIKASKGHSSSGQALGEGEDVDSGYWSDTASVEIEHDDGINHGGEEGDVTDFKRPTGVKDADWRVYEIVAGVTSEFEKKFREMWA